jgi:hypothetical protein
MLFCKGKLLRIDQTPDAESSWPIAAAHATPACEAQLRALAKRLADVGKLRTPDQFNPESDKFFAIKARCGLRAYGWYHSEHRGVFMISHFIYKTWPKLAAEDKARMRGNRKQHDPNHP